MARQVFVLEEVLAMLEVVGAPKPLIAKFRAQADSVLDRKPEKSLNDEVQVAASYGHAVHRGLVELTVNDTRTQMDTKKARELAGFLFQAAEAAESDEVMLKLLETLGIDPVKDAGVRGQILQQLREIRQGTRDPVYPH